MPADTASYFVNRLAQRNLNANSSYRLTQEHLEMYEIRERNLLTAVLTEQNRC